MFVMALLKIEVYFRVGKSQINHVSRYLKEVALQKVM